MRRISILWVSAHQVLLWAFPSARPHRRPAAAYGQVGPPVVSPAAGNTPRTRGRRWPTSAVPGPPHPGAPTSHPPTGAPRPQPCDSHIAAPTFSWASCRTASGSSLHPRVRRGV